MGWLVLVFTVGHWRKVDLFEFRGAADMVKLSSSVFMKTLVIRSKVTVAVKSSPFADYVQS